MVNNIREGLPGSVNARERLLERETLCSSLSKIERERERIAFHTLTSRISYLLLSFGLPADGLKDKS